MRQVSDAVENPRVEFSSSDYVQALFNIIEDSNAEKQRLKETQRAIINILEDFNREKERIEQSQRAVLNILDDFSDEKSRLQLTQKAVINILEDASSEKERLKETQRAVLNILEDFLNERQRLNDTQRAVINILEDLQGDKRELVATQESLVGITRELEQRVQERTKDLSIANQILGRRAEEIFRASQYKSEFLANMSHELRTPLNSMLLLADLLADNPGGNLTDKQVKFAKTISSSGSDLLALINDILDLAKVESGKMKLELSQVDLYELAERMRDTFTHIAAKKSLKFTVDIAAGVPFKIMSDRQRLEQVLKNLVSNAIKFTKVGRVAVKIRATTSGKDAQAQRGAGGQRLLFIVTDTGIGIPLEKQRLIFEAFQQADGTTSRLYGGTGLGLSISNTIATMLGGTIQVDSQPGHGSCFTLSIPEQVTPPV